MNNNKKYEIDMCEGKILGKVLLFAMPLMFSSVLQLLFNAADIIVVGRFAGDNSMGAVGSTSSLINLFVTLFVGLSIGSNVLTSKYFGAKKESDVSEVVHTSIVLAFVSGLFITIIGLFSARYILILMRTPDEQLSLATTYLRIYFLGMVSNMLYNFGSAILRSIGDTKRPLYYLFFAGIVNVLLNLLFVIFFHMDVAGVAIATIISQTISAMLVLRCLIRETGCIRLDIHQLRITKDKLYGIIRVGLPAGFQGIIFSLSNVVIQSSINIFGATVVAGNSAAANIEGFVYVAMNSFYQAAISFVGQNVGAGKYHRVLKITVVCEALVIAVGTILGLAVYESGRVLLSIYSTEEPVIAAGMVRLSVIVITYALCGMMDVMVGSLRGLGYSIMPMIVSLIGACGLRLLWLVTVFKIDRFHNVKTVYASYPISWVITFLVHVICFVIIYRKKIRIYNANV